MLKKLSVGVRVAIISGVFAIVASIIGGIFISKNDNTITNNISGDVIGGVVV